MLLMVFLFNVGGYYIVFLGLRFHSDEELRVRLDSNRYDPDETIELKIPVTLPYPIYSEGFQRVDGRFEHAGEFYKLVKHMLQNDTLYVVCIRDRETRELVNTMKDYTHLTQTLPGANEKAQNFLGKLTKDFFSQPLVNDACDVGFIVTIPFRTVDEFFDPRSIPVPAEPPEG